MTWRLEGSLKASAQWYSQKVLQRNTVVVYDLVTYISQPCLTQWNNEPCCIGPPKQIDHGRDFRQNVVHWRREWQTTSVFLPWETHKQYKKAKRYDTERWTPQVSRCQYATGGQWRNNSRKKEETEPKKKQHPVMDVTGDGSEVLCCKEQYCIGTWSPWIRQIGTGQTGDGKNEHWHCDL